MGNLKIFSEYGIDEKEIDWLVKDLLVGAGTSLLVADPKVGKSQLARHLIFACLTKNEFLGKQVSGNGKVLYLALEENPSELKKYLVSLDIEDFSQNLLIGDRSWSIDNNLKEIADDIGKHKPSLCIIDTFVAFSDLLEMNDYAKVYKPLQELSRIANKEKCHILIVHHKNKSESNGTKGIMGSQAFLAAVDTCFLLSGENVQKNLLVWPRYTPKAEFKFKMTPFEISEIEENKKNVSCREALLEKIKANVDGYDLRKFVGYSRAQIQETKKVLLDENLIFQEGGRSGEPLKLFLNKNV